MKTWFITGASRGIGLEIARAALLAGDQVAATARDPRQVANGLSDHHAHLRTIALDVTDPKAVETAVNEALEAFGHIDVLVNNAGYGQLGPFEEVSREDIERQLRTNVIGVFDVTRAALPSMRQRRSGHVITISSVAGIAAFPGSSIYSASKHAVAGWSESLAGEVAPFGIKVTCVCPGRFRTDFLDRSSVRYGDRAIDDYADFSAARQELLDANNHLQTGDPSRLAAVIVDLVSRPDAPLLLPAGSDAYGVFMARGQQLQEVGGGWKAIASSLDFK